MEKHGPSVWQTAYRLLGNHADASDCFQETFICALELSRRQSIRSFPALLVRLATTRAIDQLRRRLRYKKPNSEPADWANVPAKNTGPAQNAQNHELAQQLRRSLSILSQAEAQAFCLRCLNNMSYRQIAKELEISTNAAGVLLHRAKTKLKEALTRLEGHEERVAP